MDRELEGLVIKIRNNFRIFECGDEFFVQHKLKYKIFGIGLPLGWRYHDNNEKICLSDVVRFFNRIFWIATFIITVTSLIHGDTYLIPYAYKLR